MAVQNGISSTTLPENTRSGCKELNKLSEYWPARFSVEFQPSLETHGHIIHSAPGPIGLGLHLQPTDRRSNAMLSSMICAPASGQTQTGTHEAATRAIANAPANEKSPKLDWGGTGLPPRHDGRGWGGGGPGGGGGDDLSGGFFLFGFLAFLGYLKDLGSQYRKKRKIEDNYGDNGDSARTSL